MTDRSSSARRSGRTATALLLLLVAPFLIGWVFIYFPPFPSSPELTWAILLASVVIGVFGVTRLPVGWGWRALIAAVYMPVMILFQFMWFLSLACTVHHDCL